MNSPASLTRPFFPLAGHDGNAAPLDGWTLYVNGRKYDGGIRDLPLKAHDEILMT